MAWHRTDDEPLPEPMMTYFADAYMRNLTRGKWVNTVERHLKYKMYDNPMGKITYVIISVSIHYKRYDISNHQQIVFLSSRLSIYKVQPCQNKNMLVVDQSLLIVRVKHCFRTVARTRHYTPINLIDGSGWRHACTQSHLLHKQKAIDTLRPRQMDAIWQTTFSSAFSWMKTFEFLLKFHWNLFLRVALTIFQHWCRKWLGAGQATSHYMNQWW